MDKPLIPYAGHYKHERQSRAISPRAEELLSYFTGLAPVGQTIEVPRAVAMADVGIGNYNSFYKFLNQLINRKYVSRIACGSRRSTGVLVVLRRLESA